MIYLLGSKNEHQTNIEIQDWLDYLEISYVKILPEDILNLSVSALKEDDILWAWKGTSYIDTKDCLDSKIKEVSMFLRSEMDILFGSIISNAKQYPRFDKSEVNKLVVLDLARKRAIKTPDFIITNKKEELLDFYDREKRIITKPLSEVQAFDFESDSYVLYAEEVNKECIEVLPDLFYPSFFQVFIEKKYEVRSFFLDGSFFSMAIFSSIDNKTEVDYRKSNNKNLNRNLPYKLPKEIEHKLAQLMTDLDLNTGSIDLIKGIDDEYYFLEVNPVGQFGMTSKPCNYFLEKEIAMHLNKKNNEKTN